MEFGLDLGWASSGVVVSELPSTFGGYHGHFSFALSLHGSIKSVVSPLTSLFVTLRSSPLSWCFALAWRKALFYIIVNLNP
jgi:hypothetical protein